MDEIKILVIDDDESVIESLKDTMVNYHIDGTTSSKDGINKLKTGDFSLLILDYYVDSLNGTQIISEVRKFSNIHIWLLTGYKDNLPPLETMQRLDIQGYIDKTGDFDNIILSIETAVKNIVKYLSKPQVNSNFSNRLKELRKYYDVSQEDIANLLNLKRNTISNYESGLSEPSIENVKILAKYFGITVDYLVGYTLDYLSSRFPSH